MLYYAKIVEDRIDRYGPAEIVFPNTSFPMTGPDDEFLAENNAVRVVSNIEHNSATHKLEFVEPYILDGNVYHVKLTKFTKAEATAISKAIADFEALQGGN
jgi:hypothetical protein